MRFAPSCIVSALLLSIASARPLPAQASMITRGSGVVGVTGTRFSPLSPLDAPIEAIGVHASGSLRVWRLLDIGASAARWVPRSVVAVTPGCTSLPCQGSSTPEVLDALSIHAGVAWFEQRLRVSVGAGVLRAAGAEPGPTRTATRDVAVELRPFGRTRWRPVLGVRAVWLGEPITGFRRLLAPQVGVAF
ncbi:MAG: hypothetical protein SFW08_02380 [Gemmatimonadaceae bacterium]|nr:hypothetical protein [Gemmatimonadaceae bacterium]